MADKQALVIFGATGDLALKMIYPSLYFLDLDGHLPAGMTIMGMARAPLSDADFAAKVHTMLSERSGKYFREDAWTQFACRLRYCAGDFSQPEPY